MARKVKIQEIGINKQVMVTIPKAVASVMGFTKGKVAYWVSNGKDLILSLEEK